MNGGNFTFVMGEKGSVPDDQVVYLRCMATPPSFLIVCTKGNNFWDFLFASMDDEAFWKLGLHF